METVSSTVRTTLESISLGLATAEMPPFLQLSTELCLNSAVLQCHLNTNIALEASQTVVEDMMIQPWYK